MNDSKDNVISENTKVLDVSPAVAAARLEQSRDNTELPTAELSKAPDTKSHMRAWHPTLECCVVQDIQSYILLQGADPTRAARIAEAFAYWNLDVQRLLNAMNDGDYKHLEQDDFRLLKDAFDDFGVPDHHAASWALLRFDRFNNTAMRNLGRMQRNPVKDFAQRANYLEWMACSLVSFSETDNPMLFITSLSNMPSVASSCNITAKALARYLRNTQRVGMFGMSRDKMMMTVSEFLKEAGEKARPATRTFLHNFVAEL